MTKKEIIRVLAQRKEYYDANEHDSRVDEIEKQITAIIKERYSRYEVDFIIETLTMFGQAPHVVYDDNGMFAVTSVGYQQVVTGDERKEGELCLFVQKEQWFSSIREALWHYIQN